MRRSLSGLVLGLGLLVASLSWASFVLTKTVLDPGRSDRLAEELVENESVRSALIGRLATELGEILPVAAPVPRQALDAAATDAINEPGISEEIRRAIVEVHQNALNGVEENVTLDASALGIAARNQLVGDRPELEGNVPEAPELEVELPTAGLAFLGTIRNGVETFALLSAIGAGIAALAALIMAKDRPAVLRRVAFWAFGTSLFWLALGFGVPLGAQMLAPASAALIAGIVEIFFGAMVPPAVAMAAAGAGLLVVSAIWPSAARRRPSKAIHSRLVDAPPVQVMSTPPSAPAGSNVRDYSAQYSPHSSAPPPRHREPEKRTPQTQSDRPMRDRPMRDRPMRDRPTSDRTTVMPTAGQPGAPEPTSPFSNPSYEPPTDWTSPTEAARANDQDRPRRSATATEPHPEWKPGVGYTDKAAD